LAFLSLETKIQNGEWIPFCQKFCMVFSFILQNDGPKPKKIWVKWGTKHTLYLVCGMEWVDPSLPPHSSQANN
jgi:hypothetical protein